MLNSENSRFPNSAELFLLCKEILNIKNARGEKVTDQDVGAILNFDPADCTHWKYGRKNIKSIQNIIQIAEKLELDPRSIQDIAQGRHSLMNTISDFKNYGSFECEDTIRSRLLFEANKMIKQSNQNYLPVSINDILKLVPNVIIKKQEAQEELIEENMENENLVISWSKNVKLCGSIRFFLLEKLAKHYLAKNSERLGLNSNPQPSECRLFALFLLMPTHLLQLTSCQCDPAKDIVDQFAYLFWTTRTLVNIRLKDFFLHKN